MPASGRDHVRVDFSSASPFPSACDASAAVASDGAVRRRAAVPVQKQVGEYQVVEAHGLTNLVTWSMNSGAVVLAGGLEVAAGAHSFKRLARVVSV
jgi:hypothetical protein